MSENMNELPGAGDPGIPSPAVSEDTAAEVFPIMFEKDDMDFRPQEDDEFVTSPKGSSVQVPVSEQTSLNNLPTGLEDVSLEDLKSALALPSVGTGI